MRVIRNAGVEGSVLGAGSPSGPRASSAVWLRLRSGGFEAFVCSMEVFGSAAGAGCCWLADASGVERLAPGAADCRSFISTALLA